MSNLSAIPHHADRFASEDAFQDGARVACKIGSADDPHFYTSHPRDAQRYVHIHTICIFGKEESADCFWGPGDGGVMIGSHAAIEARPISDKFPSRFKLKAVRTRVSSTSLMPSEIVLQPGPNAAGLAEKRERLAAVRAALAEREADIAQIRSQLKAFEVRYLQRVGVLYAELDEIAARITEREVDLYDSDSARRRAQQARERAQETHQAAFGAEQEPEEFDPSPSLKTLFREVARRIHPDFASDEAEQKHFTLLMTRANHAYSCGDAETLQRLLDDQLEVNAAMSDKGADASVSDESDGLALLRLVRQIQHAERDIAALDGEHQTLLGSEIGQLYTGAEAASHEDRDLLAELAAGLRERIADAQYRLEFVERQVGALGR